MGLTCPSRASVPLGGWYSERGCRFHVKVDVSVSDDIPGGLRGTGQLIPPNCVEVRFDHKPAQSLKGAIQVDGSIVWENGRTWAYGDARAQRWPPPQPDVQSSATEPRVLASSVDDLNASLDNQNFARLPHVSANLDAEGNAQPASSVDDRIEYLNAWEEARRERLQPQPDVPSDDRCVYRTAKATGKRFHYIKDCSHAQVSITASEAKAVGLTPCEKCVGR